MLLKKHMFLRILIALTLVIGLAAVGFADKPGEGVTIRSGKASWTSAEPRVALFVLLFEELGYTMEEPILFPSNPIAYLSIAQGDIDYWPNGSFPEHYAQLPRNFERDASLVGVLCESCGIEGYLVDIPSVEKYGITSLDDFKKPEIKEAFGASKDGKVDLYGCPPGWGCHEIIEYHLDAYDLRPHLNHIQADYNMNFADVLARLNAGEPTLYYTWAPNDSVLLAVPGEVVQWINVPFIDVPYSEGMDPDLIPSEEEHIAHGLEGAVTDPLLMGFVTDDFRVAANNKFLEENPAARRLFELVKVPAEWIGEGTVRINEGEDTYEEILNIAREWIEENQDTVDWWLEEARAAAR